MDAHGNVIGEFPEQTTYLEWQHGPAANGKNCNTCHMPVASGSVKISNRPMMLAARSPFGQHQFTGGNSYMMTVIKTNAATVGATADAAQFDASISRTDTQLGTSTGALTVMSTTPDRVSQRLVFTLQVENKTGHKFPSGIPTRRAWLHVTIQDANGRVLFESGKPSADGSIAGNNADLDGTTFESHYRTISNSNQVQIYETVLLDSDAKMTYTLLRAAKYAKDNRLLPVGFNKSTAIADIAVVGEAAGDADFAAGQDQVTYDIGAPDVVLPRGTIIITAELLYQSLSYPFARDLRQGSSDLVSRFMGMYDASDRRPRLVASTRKAVKY